MVVIWTEKRGLQGDTDSHYKKSVSQVWLICQALWGLFIGGIFTWEVDKNNWQGAGAIMRQKLLYCRENNR